MATLSIGLDTDLAGFTTPDDLSFGLEMFADSLARKLAAHDLTKPLTTAWMVKLPGCEGREAGTVRYTPSP